MAASVQSWFPCDLSPAVDRLINRVRFTWCLADPVVAELPGEAPFWIVRRDRLDGFLADQAQAAGAELIDPARVVEVQRQHGGWQLRLQQAGGERLLQCRALVLAHGSGAELALSLGVGDPQPRLASAMAVELEGPLLEPHTARFEFGLVKHGFCWCFPRTGGYSIGVGTFLGKRAVDHGQVLEQMLPSLGFAATAGERRQWPLQVWNGHHPLHAAGGVVAVGDAASLADPFLAEGLRPALLSAVRAADALDRWLAGEDAALAGFTSTMREEWGESMSWGRRIAQVFYRLPKVGYQLGIKRPTAPQRIAQILSGEMGYGDIAQRVIRRLGGGMLGLNK
jgi:flavin-dependent dehydrogenase